MQYQIIPTGDFWQEGVICLPKTIAEKYIKLASEYQIKTLLVLMSAGGTAEPKDIARAIGCTENDAKEFLDFWADEGLLTADGKKVQGVLKSVDGTHFVVSVQEKQKLEGKKRPVMVEVDKDFDMNEVKYTKYLLNFK